MFVTHGRNSHTQLLLFREYLIYAQNGLLMETVMVQQITTSIRSLVEAAEREIEDALQRALGTAVRIRHARGGRGRIEIPFYSADDFERVYELLVGQPVTEVVS